MKNTKLLLGGSLLVAAIGVLFMIAPRKPQLIRIAITGSAGLSVKGSYTADGVSHDVSAIVPTNIFVTARHISYSIQKGNETGNLTVELSVHCPHHGSATTSQASGGCRGEMKDGVVALQTTF